VRHSKIGCPTSGLVKMRRTRIEHILSAFLVRFTPVSDRRADIRNRQLRANRDLTHRLFDHLVGAQQECLRDREAEPIRSHGAVTPVGETRRA
jgi:hypothetical protein